MKRVRSEVSFLLKRKSLWSCGMGKGFSFQNGESGFQDVWIHPISQLWSATVDLEPQDDLDDKRKSSSASTLCEIVHWMRTHFYEFPNVIEFERILEKGEYWAVWKNNVIFVRGCFLFLLFCQFWFVSEMII